MTLDKELVDALEKDYTTAPVTAQERVMLDYVVKITKDATKVWKDDHERLRAAGFDGYADIEIFSTPEGFWGLPVDEAARQAAAAARSLSTQS